jgi:protein-ribulosamine 3-kinase
MMNAEFESMSAIYALLPDFAPKPIAWGTYETVPDTHFFLCEYREMTEELPDAHKFTARLAALHQNSKSPNGRFGFHIPTFNGNLSQDNEGEESWETYFTKGMRHALKHETAAQGPDPELDELAPVIFDRVIPRLLRPLESEGRSVKPSLVHGDLWYANTGTDADTGEPLVFDACCFYAHNECKSSNQAQATKLDDAYLSVFPADELGQWRPVCNRLGPEYVKAYHLYVQISPPEEDYAGRLDLYKL